MDFVSIILILCMAVTSSVSVEEDYSIQGTFAEVKSKQVVELKQASLEGCSMSEMAKCYSVLPPDGTPSHHLIEEIESVEDEHNCQLFCRELYAGICTWFMFDKTTKDCKLFDNSITDLQNDCREVGYAVEPTYTECNTVFNATSDNGCYNFREDYCRFEFSLMDNLEQIKSISECQTACQYLTNCTYFLYDSISETCKLNTDTAGHRICDIVHGTPDPTLQSCLDANKLLWAGTSATCSDGIQNQDETGVDCGGSCDACPSCSDGIQNQDETSVDCGGETCDACGPSSAGLVAWLKADTDHVDVTGTSVNSVTCGIGSTIQKFGTVQFTVDSIGGAKKGYFEVGPQNDCFQMDAVKTPGAYTVFLTFKTTHNRGQIAGADPGGHGHFDTEVGFGPLGNHFMSPAPNNGEFLMSTHYKGPGGVAGGVASRGKTFNDGEWHWVEIYGGTNPTGSGNLYSLRFDTTDYYEETKVNNGWMRQDVGFYIGRGQGFFGGTAYVKDVLVYNRTITEAERNVITASLDVLIGKV